MFGSIKGLPRFENYQEAVDFAQNTNGIRGRENIIPLKNTRRDPDSYRVEMDGHGVVSCYLYRTPVLQYFPDRLVVTAYPSLTTNQFINEIAPHWFRAWMQSGQKFGIAGEGEFVAHENGKVVVEVDETYMPVKGGVKAAKLNAIILNKTRATESRKACKGVVALMTTTSKIDGYWQALVESKEETDDEDMVWLRGILKSGFYRVNEGYRGHYHYFNGGYPTETAEKLLPRVKTYLYQRQYDHDECYDYIPAEYGVIPKEYEHASE